MEKRENIHSSLKLNIEFSMSSISLKTIILPFMRRNSV